ncbi:hypothetical protein IC575_013983 [Cucumis melo]
MYVFAFDICLSVDICVCMFFFAHFSFKWPYTKNVLKRIARLRDEEYRLVDYVVGSKVDFQDPWASVDYVYSPFNVHGNHWVLLCLDLVSCQVKVWDSLVTYNRRRDDKHIRPFDAWCQSC